MESIPQSVLAAFRIEGAQATRLTGGRVNQSFRIDTMGKRYLLQHINADVEPASTDDIRLVTERLAQQGMETPRLCTTGSGELEHDDGGIWRLLTWIEGRTTNSVDVTLQEVGSAARLLARFHGALIDMPDTLHPRIPGFHDMGMVLARLSDVHANQSGSSTHERIQPLFARVISEASKLPSLSGPLRICHGDPKVANIVFSEQSSDARALIDLGAVGRYPLVVELGDMLRSFCSGSEGFHADRYDVALHAYRSEAPFLTEEEARLIPVGLQSVSYELAARYLTDAYENRVFIDEYGDGVERKIDRAGRLLALGEKAGERV